MVMLIHCLLYILRQAVEKCLIESVVIGEGARHGSEKSRTSVIVKKHGWYIKTHSDIGFNYSGEAVQYRNDVKSTLLPL